MIDTERNSIRCRKYYWENRETVLEKVRTKRALHRDELNAYRREYYAKNRERMKDLANTRYFKKKLKNKEPFKSVQGWTKWVYANPILKKKLVGV